MPYASCFIEIDNIEVPTGALATVHHTPLDFTSPKPIGCDMFTPTDINTCGYYCTGYDNSFIIDRPLSSSPVATDISVLTLSSPALRVDQIRSD